MRVVAIDTETTWKNCKNIPFIATTAEYVNNKIISNLYDLRKKKDYVRLKALCENKNIRKVFHNATYDITCLENIDIKCVGPFEDTMIMAGIINENYSSRRLKTLAKIFLDEPCNEDKELGKIKTKLTRELQKKGVLRKGEKIPYDMIPTNILYPYAKKDAIYTIKLWKLWQNEIKKYQDVYDLEVALIPIIVEMQLTGMKIDRKFVKKMYDDYSNQMKDCYKDMCKIIKKKGVKFEKSKIYKRYPRQIDKWDKITEQEDGTCYAVKNIVFNPDSDDQVRTVLNALEVVPSKITEKSGKVSVSKDSIIAFSHISFVKSLLRYNFLTKQVGTYYGPLYEWYTSDTNDVAHFSLYQSGAKSGRFSAELVQTIPRKDEDKAEEDIRVIRNAFIPSKNYNILCLDYDQIEMRLFAHFSNCITLIKDILKGMDPHDSTTVTLFGKKAKNLLNEIEKYSKLLRKAKDDIKRKKYKQALDKVKTIFKGLRRIAKGINFGIIYGMGQNKLALQLGLSLYEALDILRIYYSKYPVKKYMAEVVSLLYRTGSVDLLFDSSLMRLYRKYRVPQELAYKAVNIIIQGTAAYIMKMGMLRCYNWIKKNKLNIKMVMTLHDELIFYVHKKYDLNKTIDKLKTLMEDHVTFKVPILASAKMSDKSWGDAK